MERRTTRMLFGALAVASIFAASNARASDDDDPRTRIILGPTDVRLASDKPATLYRVFDTQPAIPVCTAPCASYIAPGRDWFVVRGESMPGSKSFVLPHDGPLDLHVKTGTKSVYASGFVIVFASSLIAAAGFGVAMAKTLAFENASTQRDFILAGALTSVVGVAGVLGGTAMIIEGRTRVVSGDGIEIGKHTFRLSGAGVTF